MRRWSWVGRGACGQDLHDIVEQARGVARVIEDVHSRYARFVVEQAAIGGVFEPSLLLSADQANTVRPESPSGLIPWPRRRMAAGAAVSATKGFVFRREVRGVGEVHTLDRALLAHSRRAG
jgi:DNA gyrase subunit B